MTHVLAGPYCSYQLSMLGAEVIKVENPKGDMTRTWGGDALGWAEFSGATRAVEVLKKMDWHLPAIRRKYLKLLPNWTLGRKRSLR